MVFYCRITLRLPLVFSNSLRPFSNNSNPQANTHHKRFSIKPPVRILRSTAMHLPSALDVYSTVQNILLKVAGRISVVDKYTFWQWTSTEISSRNFKGRKVQFDTERERQHSLWHDSSHVCNFLPSLMALLQSHCGYRPYKSGSRPNAWELLHLCKVS